MAWFAACGPAGHPGAGAHGSGCTVGRCGPQGYEACLSDGSYAPPVACHASPVCVPELGCRACVPGTRYCAGADGNAVWMCNGDGSGGDPVGSCQPDEECSQGSCVSPCQKAAAERSNVGCEYWPVDLDNEYSAFNDAAAQQFAVVLANTSSRTVDVTVAENDAEPGQPASIRTVATAQVAPMSLVRIDLPRREVDGSLAGMDEGPGTMLSSRAYRVRTTSPVVAYQFNPIVQSFSNGASLLIPTSGLDDFYWVLGWPTANPIAGPFGIPGIPDHSFVTIVGVGDNPVHVTVSLAGAIVGGGGIAAAPAGRTVEADLGAFDVLNLESDGIPGDLTGTQVRASGPVVVFTGGERAIVPVDVMPPPPANYDPSMLCCTEHFEQQQFPTSSLGKVFVATRSPVRSRSAQNPEADVWRVLGTRAGTTVTTNLPAPFDHFTVEPGQAYEFWSQNDFVLEASAPVIVGQFLVSQGYVEDPDVGGDPEFILFPPVEQYRLETIFLTPPTFERNYCVIAAPEQAQVLLDGMNLAGEFSTFCQKFPAGMVGTDRYVALRCPLGEGIHRVMSDVPVGVTVYGYYNVGSYGYAAGTELQRINVE